MHVGGPVGEEDVAPAGQLHQRHALAGELALEPLADAAGAERLELHLALVGDHGAGAGHDLAVELDLQHLGVLQRAARAGVDSFSRFSAAKSALCMGCSFRRSGSPGQ